MGRKAIAELHSKTIMELKALAQDKRRQIVLLRLKKRIGRAKNVHELKSVRDDLARVLTILRQRELKEKLINQKLHSQ